MFKTGRALLLSPSVPSWHIINSTLCYWGSGTSVSIATDYGLDSLGVESQWGRDCSHTSRPALGTTQPPVQWVLGLSRGQSDWGVVLTTHPLLVPRLRMGTVTSLPPLQGHEACNRVNYTFTLCYCLIMPLLWLNFLFMRQKQEWRCASKLLHLWTPWR
jgi:hypothetical protein